MEDFETSSSGREIPDFSRNCEILLEKEEKWSRFKNLEKPLNIVNGINFNSDKLSEIQFCSDDIGNNVDLTRNSKANGSQFFLFYFTIFWIVKIWFLWIFIIWIYSTNLKKNEKFEIMTTLKNTNKSIKSFVYLQFPHSPFNSAKTAFPILSTFLKINFSSPF